MDVYEAITEIEIDTVFRKFPNAPIIISSVASINETLGNYLQDRASSTFLNSETPLPIINDYLSPETLGNDRIANVVGAKSVFPNHNALVIDLGTCMKFDFITDKGVYKGGAISPGLNMRYKALHQFTDQLPLIEPVDVADLIGNSTINSINSGVFNGMLAEIKGIIYQYKLLSTDLKVILTGGDLRFFSIHLKNDIFAAPYLTLEGLNEILLYNQ